MRSDGQPSFGDENRRCQEDHDSAPCADRASQSNGIDWSEGRPDDRFRRAIGLRSPNHVWLSGRLIGYRIHRRSATLRLDPNPRRRPKLSFFARVRGLSRARAINRFAETLGI